MGALISIEGEKKNLIVDPFKEFIIMNVLDQTQNTILFVNSGKVLIESCFFNLRFVL